METTAIQLWTDSTKVQEIKKVFAPNLSDSEFSTLVGIGQATGLNPFLREIWAVKYGNNPASIFVGRDGYRKTAQSNPDYDYHLTDAVYQNDSFSVTDGEVKHSYSVKQRGMIIGAYCVVKRKKSSKPIFTFVELKEYSTGKSLWGTKPATMIKKVAEAQGLRMAFQGIFAGTYDESEAWEVKEVKNTATVATPPQKKENIEGFIDKTAKKKVYELANVKAVQEHKDRLMQNTTLEFQDALYDAEIAYCDERIKNELQAWEEKQAKEAEALKREITDEQKVEIENLFNEILEGYEHDHKVNSINKTLSRYSVRHVGDLKEFLAKDLIAKLKKRLAKVRAEKDPQTAKVVEMFEDMGATVIDVTPENQVNDVVKNDTTSTVETKVKAEPDQEEKHWKTNPKKP
jgi:phage recombination protein Bet